MPGEHALKGIPAAWPNEGRAVDAMVDILGLDRTRATKLVRSALKSREHELIKEHLAEAGEYGGFFARPEDANVIIEHERTKPYARMEIQPGDVVLDVGANIGTTVRYALEQGAAHVIAIEPVPETAELLRRNCAGRPVTVLEGAVGASQIWVASVPSCATAFPPNEDRVQGNRIAVQELNIVELIERYRPHAVKLDCEGAEWPLFLVCGCDFGPRARTLGFEGHVYSHEAKVHAAEVWRLLAEQGWRGRSPYKPPVGHRRMFYFVREDA